MKSFAFVVIAVVCATLVAAQNDELDKSMDHCLEVLNLMEVETLSDEQKYCFYGCMLQEFYLIDEDGKFLTNGTQSFIRELSTAVEPEYLAKYPNLEKDLTKLEPELKNATNACTAGKIVGKAVAGVFETVSE
ncbi:uncharacterized protein LOC116343602 [Contarinia nasturtii]|uniref:uncharacterized protein LOC116343602 n=1 Tax=Contarinia nasturtii TaxID=265458 RepID=UPI0012D3A872|nr:uncharacterized protein LOC116343602 [Contarinia nasturtii]